jgi:hypothetical protein
MVGLRKKRLILLKERMSIPKIMKFWSIVNKLYSKSAILALLLKHKRMGANPAPATAGDGG